MSTQSKRNNADDSAESLSAADLGLIPNTDQPMSLSKILAIIVSILGILAIILAFGSSSLDTHKEGLHNKSLSKEVYTEHVKLADERHTAIIGKLDTLLERK